MVVQAFRGLFLLAVASLCGLVGPFDARAQEADGPDILQNCTIEPREPEVLAGEIYAPVALECLTGMEGRKFVVALQQRMSDGSYQSVTGSVTHMSTSGDFTGNEEIIGMPVECRLINGQEAFRTAIRIRESKQSSPWFYSNWVELPQDCFGGEFQTVISEADALLATACTTASMTDEAVAAGLKRNSSVAAEATVTSLMDPLAEALQIGMLPESDLPSGVPADPETTSAITELESEFADCFNAGELRHMASLLSGDFLREILQLTAEEGFPGNRFQQPYPVPVDERITSAVRDVNLFPDGRVGAIVEWEKTAHPERESTFHVYEQVDGEWRISDEIKLP